MNKNMKKYLPPTLLCALLIHMSMFVHAKESKQNISNVFSPITSWWPKSSAQSILKVKAENPHDKSQDKDLMYHLKKLSAKDKQEVFNEWMNIRSKKIKDAVNLIKADKSIEKLEKDTAIQAKKEQHRQEVDAMKDNMSLSLNSHEVLITALTAKKQLQFEVVDMAKIDPTQPLTQQYDALVKYEGLKVGPHSLTKIVTRFYADKVTLDLSKQVDNQILNAIADWNNFDKQLQSDILNKLATKIPEESTTQKELQAQAQRATKIQKELERRDKLAIQAEILQKQRETQQAKLEAEKQRAQEIKAQHDVQVQEELQRLDALAKEAATLKRQQEAEQARRNAERQEAQAQQELQRLEKLALQAEALKKQRAEKQQEQQAQAKQDAQARQELQRLEKLAKETKALKKQQDEKQAKLIAEKQRVQQAKAKLAAQVQQELQQLEKLAKEAANYIFTHGGR